MKRLALVLLALLTFPATAAAQWTPAPPFGEPAPVVGSPHPVFGEAGRALVAWDALSAAGPAVTYLAAWTPGSAVTEPRRLAGTLLERPVRIRRERVLLLRRTGPPERQRLHATIAGTDGRLVGRSERIRPFRIAYASALASNRKGDAAVAWVEPHGTRDRPRLRLRLALRRPGKRFGPGRVVTGLGADEHPGPAAVAMAYHRHGTLVIVVTTVRADGRRQVHALIGRPGRWRRQVLGRHHGVTDVVAARNGAGHVVVAWQTQDGGEEADRPAEVRAAVFDAMKRRFARTRLLDPGNAAERWPGSIAAAASPDGRLAVTWSQVAPRFTYPVVVATAEADGRFGAPVTLDASGAAGDVAFGPDGALLVTWSRITRENYQAPDQIFAAYRGRAPGSTFGPAEAVSQDTGAGVPAADADPLTGRFAVGWGLNPAHPSTEPGRPQLALRTP